MRTNRDLFRGLMSLVLDPISLVVLKQLILARGDQNFLNKVLADEEFDRKFQLLLTELPAFIAQCARQHFTPQL